MTILALILSAVLLALAGLHILWAIGFWFPIRDEAALVKAVIAWSPWWGESLLRQASVGLFALVFLVRGALAYTSFWRRLTPQEPFATLDRTRYGPLCLAIGLGFVVLWLGRPV